MGTTQLFVGRLPRDMRSSELEKVFTKYGNMSRCDVKRGSNLSYGFVEFDNLEDAEVAIRECNDMDFHGDRIIVEFAKGAARAKRENGSNTCFRCHQEGHWARDCPEGGSRRGGRSRSRSPRKNHRRRSRSRDDSSRRSRHRRSHRDDDRRGSRYHSRSRSRSRSPYGSRGSGGRRRGNSGSDSGSSRGHGRSQRRGSRSPAGRSRGARYTDRDAPAQQDWAKKSGGGEEEVNGQQNGNGGEDEDGGDNNGWGM